MAGHAVARSGKIFAFFDQRGIVRVGRMWKPYSGADEQGCSGEKRLNR
jgi:hypothetical protein